MSPGATLSPNSTVTDASPSSVTRRTHRRGGGSRLGSRFRGVTHHSRTARYESHLWDNGKQVYLGGYNIEAAAALAYDLAGVSFRGQEALLNGRWSLVEKEMASRHTISREEVIQKLRNQSKLMNKINQNPPGLNKKELLISQAMNPSMEHLGIFRTPEDAARAVDRALIQRLGGVLASSFLNFPLYEYIDVLKEDDINEAVATNIIPAVLPAELSPTAPPTPVFHLRDAEADVDSKLDGDDSHPEAVVVERKQSETSVLDAVDELEECDDEVGVKREDRDDCPPEESNVRRSKRARRGTEPVRSV
jgi:hypothetical protein